MHVAHVPVRAVAREEPAGLRVNEEGDLVPRSTDVVAHLVLFVPWYEADLLVEDLFE